MEIKKRDEFKKLLEDNPGRKFAFYEYKPYTFMSELHITMGDATHSTFGAWSPNPPLLDEAPDGASETPGFKAFYDWDLLADYKESDLFAVLDDSEVMFMISQLKDVAGDDAKTLNELRVEEGLPPVEDIPAIKQKKVEYKVVRSYNPACNTSYRDLEKAFEDGWQFVRASDYVEKNGGCSGYIEYILIKEVEE